MAFSARFPAITRIIRGRSGSSASGSPSARSVRPARAAFSPRALGDLLEDRESHGRAERNELPAGLELAEEEDVVDQLSDLPHLGLGLVDQIVLVGVGERRRLEQGEEPRERRAELVRDRGGEAGAKLLVRRQVAGVAHVYERLLRLADVVGDGERIPENGFRRRLPLRERVEELACAAARRHDPSLRVEHDHDLPALLDEDPAALGVEARLRSRGRSITLKQSLHQSFTTPTPIFEA